MRPRFFTAPVAAVAALVLLGATVGGLVLANQPSSPPAAPADGGTQRDDGATQPAPVPTATPEPTADRWTGADRRSLAGRDPACTNRRSGAGRNPEGWYGGASHRPVRAPATSTEVA